MNKAGRHPEEASPALTFGSLVNRRILIPSERTNLVAVDKYFLVRLLRSQVERIYVDEIWYFSKYPDIRHAFEAGRIASAKEHYGTDGYYEHRLPYEIIVNESWYMKQYPDVRAAIDGQHFESAQMHFEAAGYREGREPFVDFRLACDDTVFA